MSTSDRAQRVWTFDWDAIHHCADNAVTTTGTTAPRDAIIKDRNEREMVLLCRELEAARHDGFLSEQTKEIDWSTAKPAAPKEP
jgi:hypothetical protein